MIIRSMYSALHHVGRLTCFSLPGVEEFGTRREVADTAEVLRINQSKVIKIQNPYVVYPSCATEIRDVLLRASSVS